MPQKQKSEIALIAPATETLLSRRATSLWPREILNHPGIVAQTALRNQLRARLESFFTQVSAPETPLETVLHAGAVRQEEIAELYALLATFLESDPCNGRLVLYLPFELLPNRAAASGQSEILAKSLDRFAGAYMKCWRELLRVTDVRANFVDGNILEPELAPQGQRLVRKAAHLIPVLVQKGLLSLSEVCELENSSDGLLRESIADALPALGKGQPAGAQVLPDRGATVASENHPDWPMALADELEAELQKIDMRFALDQSRGFPPARVDWERRNRREILASKYAEKVAAQLLVQRGHIGAIGNLLSEDTPDFVRLVVVRILGALGEKLAEVDRAEAAEVHERLWRACRRWAPGATPEIGDELRSVLSRWLALGIISKAAVQSFGFELPRLDPTFSERSPLADEIRGYTPVLESIARDPEYRRLLYPAAIFFGSRFKGYAKSDADLDAAVFVRSGISENDRQTVRKAVARAFKGGSVGGKVVEFWLEQQGDGLGVRDLPDPDAFVADSTWVHLLFAGAWLGESATVEELHRRLLPGFLFSRGKTVKEHDARTVWLGEIEREVLQYRLMHKGYRRFFPVRGGIRGPGAERLDCQSAFWDSGYRGLATKLFVTRVFLPDIGDSSSRFDKLG